MDHEVGGDESLAGEVFEVVAVRSTRISLYNTQRGVKEIGGDVELTLRKSNV